MHKCITGLVCKQNNYFNLIVLGLVSRYGGSYGGQFVLFGLASPSKNSSLAEIWRMAAFFGKEDLPNIEQPLKETFSLEDEQKSNRCLVIFGDNTLKIGPILLCIPRSVY